MIAHALAGPRHGQVLGQHDGQTTHSFCVRVDQPLAVGCRRPRRPAPRRRASFVFGADHAIKPRPVAGSMREPVRALVQIMPWRSPAVSGRLREIGSGPMLVLSMPASSLAAGQVLHAARIGPGPRRRLPSTESAA